MRCVRFRMSTLKCCKQPVLNMIRSICGNEAFRRLCGAWKRVWRSGPDAARPRTDARHRANFRHACGVILLAMVLTSIACSARVVHEQSPQTASLGAININVASADELEKLPGIGRKTADTIIAFRNENGPFRRVEYLMLIRGISEERFIELRPYIRAE